MIVVYLGSGLWSIDEKVQYTRRYYVTRGMSSRLKLDLFMLLVSNSDAGSGHRSVKNDRDAIRQLHFLLKNWMRDRSWCGVYLNDVLPKDVLWKNHAITNLSWAIRRWLMEQYWLSSRKVGSIFRINRKPFYATKILFQTFLIMNITPEERKNMTEKYSGRSFAILRNNVPIQFQRFNTQQFITTTSRIINFGTQYFNISY